MRRLVGDLLLLARADAERHQPHRPVDLGAILTDAAAELGQLADDHDLSIAPGRAEIEGRPDDLHRLVLNLMENALRHTPPGTTVRARSGVRDGIAELIVEDEGPGIPPHLRERVFDRFVRGGGDAGDGARGTGLGLAIVRAVAQAHGARVTLGSLEDGCGTQFVIRFPQRRAGQEDSSPPGELPAQTSTTTGSTIGRRRNRS
jgi:two-component system OmpR family sensor kinase